jgi:hypothetical protein
MYKSKFQDKSIYMIFHIFKLNDLKVIHDLYFQCLTQTLSKTTSNSDLEGVSIFCKTLGGDVYLHHKGCDLLMGLPHSYFHRCGLHSMERQKNC